MYICNKNRITGFIFLGELNALHVHEVRDFANSTPHSHTFSGAQFPQRCRQKSSEAFTRLLTGKMGKRKSDLRTRNIFTLECNILAGPTILPSIPMHFPLVQLRKANEQNVPVLAAPLFSLTLFFCHSHCLVTMLTGQQKKNSQKVNVECSEWKQVQCYLK